MSTDSLGIKKIWQVNGRIYGDLPPSDRGLAYGDGLFETMRFDRGQCALAAFHWTRLLSGCERLSIPLDRRRLLDDCQAFLANLGSHGCETSGLIKLIVTRGVGGRGYAPPTPSRSTLIWQWSPLPEESAENETGVALSVSPVRLAQQKLLAGLKHLNRLEYVLAADAAKAGAIPLLLDTDGFVVESLSHNIFFTREGQVITPQLVSCGVEGVLKQYALQKISPALNIPMREESVSLAQLMAADEVFIGNSVRGFWPVTLLASNSKSVRWPIGNVFREFHSTHQAFLKSTHG
jgi:4-amino-4-deoxychorismate lyase